MTHPTPEFVVLSREKAECYKPSGVEVCISILDPRSEPARLSPDFADVLRLYFSDIASPSTAPGDVLFDQEHVEAIDSFLARWPNVDRIVVHCMAGVSRSPGVALGICDSCGWSTTALEEAYPSWNRWVRTKLRSRAADQT
jgi:predicted protein tyrosine phosphatase